MKQEVYHFIGIGGIGMSGLARILASRGKKVTGSDISASYVTKGLEELGVIVYIGHNASYITPDTTVIVSTEIPATNPEFDAAKKYACKMLHRSDLLKELMDGYRVLSVAGTHGKTTTSSLLTHVLKSAGIEPSFAVGGILCGHNTNASEGKGIDRDRYFVVEADESDGTFLKYPYEMSIITNIDTDHLNYYGSLENLIKAFRSYIAGKTGIVYCADDPLLRSLKPQGISYGFSEYADLKRYCSSTYW
jgi:UDP-N-acetylmuramate--alanine ligase